MLINFGTDSQASFTTPQHTSFSNSCRMPTTIYTMGWSRTSSSHNDLVAYAVTVTRLASLQQMSGLFQRLVPVGQIRRMVLQGRKVLASRSVFKVADVVWIASGPYRFKFDKQQKLSS